MRLYQALSSSASWRVRIALALKRIPYQPAWLSLEASDNLAEEYLRINPVGQVPCLEIEGLRLTQSVAIIEYLDEAHPEPPLFPPDAAGRAAVRAVVELINSGIQPLHNSAIRRALREQFGASDEATQAWCRHFIDKRLYGLEQQLRPRAGSHCLGDSLSAADVFLYPQAFKAVAFGVDIGAYPTISRIVRQLDMREEFCGTRAPSR